MIWHTFFQPFIEFGFMRRALLVCLALSLSTTMLGVFLLLRRMSLMGDALSHAIVPGVAGEREEGDQRLDRLDRGVITPVAQVTGDRRRNASGVGNGFEFGQGVLAKTSHEGFQ